jgi:hypothetical protein
MTDHDARATSRVVTVIVVIVVALLPFICCGAGALLYERFR